ncbi:XdhC family protein [Aureibaculum conchae]|uniref:XdhC family protein n=1 Tax=Aureibaculum sp. 2308TA14-22 TaxID=3108392 RepID=UPI00339AD350
MTHEFKKIIKGYQEAEEKGLQSIVATVVALDGSSYRKPGVRMLITENGQMIGAVSGGCVEKEILKQTYSVFKTGISKVMTYDGRYRLGCEGVLYILLELFHPEAAFINTFKNCLEHHNNFSIHSFYSKDIGSDENYGSSISFDDEQLFSFNQNSKVNRNASLQIFSQILKPCFRLVIIGAEHDAVELCSFAAALGWDVFVIASLSDSKTITDFRGAQKVLHESPESIDASIVKEETAIVLMTHSYAKDLQYLITLKDKAPEYIGILGSVNRREKLLNEIMELCPLINDEFFEKIHSPAGLNIGAITPQEIALSICAEILAVTRKKDPGSLRNTMGSIHSDNYLA